ncbi:Propionyl-CoA carboxylase beta chain [Sinobacterium norvegicum]|uniref:Propionyl-CoA carboxylase beta chain n=1 Tax=Sinobacterium norvegicum TaxID=1641715 RepID=A0ABN8EFU6_9GAMM|nr:carboxyl transferase domain-containing protein [Sinobacterium norvegicum]CAH0991289.1 Propionyl-CoA carboxylase beta chain [Sinobacterium norvegicum]
MTYQPIKSAVDGNDERYIKNASAAKKAATELADIKTKIAASLPSKYPQRLSVRARIERLIDSRSEFFEIGMLAAYAVYDEHLPAAGLVVGVGKVCGVRCMIFANDAAVKGGCYFPLTVKKHLRGQAIAQQNKLPCLYLVDSGGANLALQSELFADADGFGRIFYQQARMSAEGIAQFAAVMGSCTAGGAYLPAMSEETIIVQQQGTIFLAGPPLVEQAIGEITDSETLGGGHMHCSTSAVCDYLAVDDADAIAQLRSLVGRLPASYYRGAPLKSIKPPRYAAEQIYPLIPSQANQPVNGYELIAHLVDDSQFDEFKALYGRTLICGFAHIKGMPVGIVANNGILFSESAIKGSHFIQLCCQRKIPLVFLHNVTGFMVGTKVEQEGIARHGAKLVTAVACADVPKITLITGNSYGAGNYGMCGRAYNPSFLFLWPNANTAVMGGAQAAGVFDAIAKKNKKIKRPNNNVDSQDLIEQYQAQSTAYYSSARLWDDGIIDPADSRAVIAESLSICLTQPVKESRFGVFRM